MATPSSDRYGNRTAQSVTVGTAPSTSVVVNAATNQITTSGYSYDASGNMLNDAINTMTYDAENRALTSSGTYGSATYTYDGNGLRVEKSGSNGSTIYIFSGSKVIGEYAPGAQPSSPTTEYIYAGGNLVASIASGTPTYYHPDQLSARALTSSTGSVVGQQGHYPFGESWYSSGTTTKWKFTSYERDPESGNDYSIARYHVNRLGRFNSPDPLGGSIASPQSLNRYAYVRNDPVSSFDPTGLDCVYISNDGTSFDSIDSNSNEEECEGSDANGNPNGGIWFNGTVDPGSIIIDPNSDYVFANGTAGNNQFSCVLGGACDQDSLDAFVNSVVGSNPVMVYSPGTNSGTIQSGLSLDLTIQWFQSTGIGPTPLELGHPGKVNLRSFQPTCSTHVTLNPQVPGQPTTGQFHIDTVNPWAFPPDSFLTPGAMGSHGISDVIPDILGFNVSASVCH